MHYHKQNINSLAWCPVPFSSFSSDQSTETLLLASIAYDISDLCISRFDMFDETTVALPMAMGPLRKPPIKYIYNCIDY